MATNPRTGESSSWEIADERIRVGRSPKSEIHLDHETIAPEHAVFRVDGGLWITNLTASGVTATHEGPLSLGEARRLPGESHLQVGTFVIHYELILPTHAFDDVLDASALQSAEELTVPKTWLAGGATICGVPLALNRRTWAVLSRLADRPREALSLSALTPESVAAESPNGFDVPQTIRTLRRQIAVALADQEAHGRLAMALNVPGVDPKETAHALVETCRGEGYRLNLAPALLGRR